MTTEQLEFRLEKDGHRYSALLAGQEIGHSEVDPIGKERRVDQEASGIHGVRTAELPIGARRVGCIR
jgi:hypothetical protein